MIQELWPGGPGFKEDNGVFRVGVDSVLLAHFVNSAKTRKRNRAVDLGCGSGIISVLLALDNHGLRIDSVEIDPRAAHLATENAVLCGVSDRITVYEADLRNHRDYLRNGEYDISVSNPPYNPHGSGKRASSPGLITAREDEKCSLTDLCSAAAYLTRWGGSFFIVHKPERLPGVFRALNDNGFEPKRIRFVQHKSATPPNLVLIESRRGGKPSLTVETPLILVNDDDSDSDEVKEIYRI